MKKEVQLFVLPFAGGTASSFNKMADLLDDRIDMVPVEYVGHGKRSREGCIENYEYFLDDVASFISARRDSSISFAMFGYSMGSVLLYDLLSRRLVSGRPVYAFVCAKGSIMQKQYYENFNKLTNREFVEEIASLGGMDPRILRNERFLQIYMDLIKADYKVLGQFTYRPGKIPCCLTAVYGKADPASEGVGDWSRLSEGEVEYKEMGEGHFFIKKCWGEVADIVNVKLRSFMGGESCDGANL